MCCRGTSRTKSILVSFLLTARNFLLMSDVVKSALKLVCHADGPGGLVEVLHTFGAVLLCAVADPWCFG